MATTVRMTPIPLDIERQSFDVIVIGAGINGAGIARDAAMRGLEVLLIDKGDIASGTTARSTRLIHGGLRYLEYYEVPLVRESLREREILLHIAPNLVHPLPFLIPIYEGGKRGPKLIRLGMMAYDVLSFDKSMKRHHMLSREQTLQLEPGLTATGLLGAAYYYDAQITFPERLTVENVLAARDKGAVVLTYCKVDHPLTDDNGNVTGIAFTDCIGGGTYSVHAPITVNVAGPWVDEVIGVREKQRYIGGTKGSHIVVDAFPGAPKEALYVEAAADRRPYFIVPWNGRYLIGTTDIRHKGDFDNVVPNDDELEYLVNETNRVIPEAHLKRTDILYAYAGVRPLPYKEEGTPGSITRKHVIHVHKAPLNGMISIIGGKITTYRRLAEQTVDAVFKLLKRPAPPSLTSKMPLPCANTYDFDRFAANLKSTSGLDESVVQRLVRIYGVHAKQITQLAGDDPVLRGSFSPDTGAIGAEVPYAVQSELAETLVDILMHRTMIGLDASVGRDAVDNAVKIAQQTLGWDEERARAERAGYRDYVQYLRPRALPDEVPLA